MVTANLLQACDDVRESYQERFSQILVDEFQDTNHAQNEIVQLLGQAHGNVCVVGDSDQSVYKWRGADIRNILEFEQAFPSATIIVLEQNFRSTQTILSVANAVIANNLDRPDKQLFTVGDAGDPVLRYRAEDERDEALVGLGRDPAAAGGRVAGLGRRRRLLPHQRPEPGARGLLHLHRDPLQGGGRGQVLRPARGQGRAGLRAGPGQPRRRGVGPPHRQRAQARHRRHLGGPPRRLGPGEPGVVQRGHRPGRGGRPRPARPCGGAEQLSKTLAELRPLVSTVNPADFIQLVADRTGYMAELVAEHTHESDGRIENIAELGSVAGQFDDVVGFLETVALVADSDDLDGDGTRVSLMTLHTAKGLEFPAVFVVGLEDGIFPHLRSLERAGRPRRGAPALLRRHHPGPPPPQPVPRLVPHHLRPDPAEHPEPLPRRGPHRAGQRRRARHHPGEPQPLDRRPTSGTAIAATGRDRSIGAPGSDRPVPHWLVPPSSPLAPRPAGPRASSGAEELGLVAGRPGGARPLGPGRRDRRQRRGIAGPGHGRLRVGGEEEPPPLGHPAAPGLNPGLAPPRRASLSSRLHEASLQGGRCQARARRPRPGGQGHRPRPARQRLRGGLHRPAPDARAGGPGGRAGGCRRGRALPPVRRAPDAGPPGRRAPGRGGARRRAGHRGGDHPRERHPDPQGAGRGRGLHPRRAARLHRHLAGRGPRRA